MITTVMIKNNDFIIYANGCSFTSGAELDLSNDQNLEKQLAWPAQLGKIMDITVINKSAGGSCQEQITLNSKEDLRKLKSNHKNILAIIQLTFPYRLLYPLGGHGETIDIDDLWDGVLVSEDYKDTGYKNAQEFLYRWDDLHIYTKYFNDIENLINFCVINSIKIFLVPLSNENFPEHIKKYFFKDDFYWKEKLKNINPGGHPTLDEHILLAQLLSTLPNTYKYKRQLPNF